MPLITDAIAVQYIPIVTKNGTNETYSLMTGKAKSTYFTYLGQIIIVGQQSHTIGGSSNKQSDY